MTYPRIATLKTAEAFRAHLDGTRHPARVRRSVAPRRGVAARRSRSRCDGVRVGNRFCILPMEGWDGTSDGEPSELTRRRWRNFGISGAKLMWGGEAVAVRHDGRANPNQLLMTPRTSRRLRALRDELVARAPRALRCERRRAICSSVSS